MLIPMVAYSALYAAHVVDAHPLIWYGVDLEIMRELGRRWIESGTMYLPYQLAGPYSIEVTLNLATTPALYPPAAGPLFAVVSLLPWPVAVVAWWGVPLAIVGYAFARWRPSPLAWALALLMFAHPMTTLQLMTGGTAMWAAALVAAGLLWHWPAALILVKPTLLPFALIGSRHRSWWLAGGVVVVAMLLGPWRDYVSVARNGLDSGGILYSLSSVPILLVPVIAWLWRDDHAHVLRGHRVPRRA